MIRDEINPSSFSFVEIDNAEIKKKEIQNLNAKKAIPLPQELQQAKSLSSFKEGIKNWKPVKCPCKLCKTFVPDLGYL